MAILTAGFAWTSPSGIFGNDKAARTKPGSLQNALDDANGGPLGVEFFEDYYHIINGMTEADRLRRFNSAQLQQLEAYEHKLSAIAMKAKQAREDKFEAEVQAKGAVRESELGSAAFDTPFDVCRQLFIAAGYGSKWLDPTKLEGEHQLMFTRLYRAAQFEDVEFADMQSQSFSKRYRLKGT